MTTPYYLGMFVLFFLVSWVSASCDVYVDLAVGVDSPSSGDSGSPYASITYALLQIFHESCEDATVSVASGTYNIDSIPFFNNITITAESGPTTTIIAYMNRWSDFGTYTWKGFTFPPGRMTSGTVFMYDCIFAGNTAPLIFDQVSVTLSNCQFRNNVLGAVAAFNSFLTIEYCTFSNNSFVTDSSGAGCIVGSYVYVPTTSDTASCGGSALATYFSGVSMYRNQFIDNYVTIVNTKSGIALQGGAVTLQGATTVIIEECFFKGNRLNNYTGDGESLYIWTQTLNNIIRNTEFVGYDCTKSTGTNICIVGNSNGENVYMTNVTVSNLCNTALVLSYLNTVELTDSKFKHFYNLPYTSQYSITSGTVNVSISDMLVYNVSMKFIQGSNVYITKSKFQRNNVSNGDTILYNAEGVDNCEFLENPNPGGCIELDPYHPYHGLKRVSNCVFDGNAVAFRYVPVLGPTGPINTIFDNCRFVNNQYGIIYHSASADNISIYVYNSLFQNNTQGAISMDIIHVWLENTTFINNTAPLGGALYLTGCNATITNCSFIENKASGIAGGAIYFDPTYATFRLGPSSPTVQTLDITHSNFDANSAQGINSLGGVIFSKATSFNMTIVNSEFSFSSATNGGVLGFEANAVVPSTRIIKIDNCTFLENSAGISGGVIYATDLIDLSITTSVFKNNSCSQQGGSIFLDSAKMNLQHSSMISCNAGFDGGAIYISVTGKTDNVDFTITNVTFDRNSVTFRSGGALAIATINPVPLIISNCSFVYNSALSFGGAVYSTSNSQPLFVTSTFSFNKASQGGALYADKQAQLNCSFLDITKNMASLDGGGISCSGASNSSFSSVTFYANYAGNGGASSTHAQATVSFDSCTFISNGASLGGGAAYANAIVTQSPQFYNCIFKSNTAPNGGAFYTVSGSPKLTECNFSNNFANTSGGAAYISKTASPQFQHVALSDNLAYVSGGGIQCEGSTLLMSYVSMNNNIAGKGGAINAQQGCIPKISSSEFASNVAYDSGGSIYIEENIFAIQANSFTNNSAKNGGGIYFSNGMDNRTSIFANNLFQLNAARNGGGAFFWDLDAISPNQEPQCTLCSYLQNTASYGRDYATETTRIEFENTPPPLDVFDGVIGPFQIRVADFYNQSVFGSEPAQIQVTISGLANESIPVITGATEATVVNGTASFEQLDINGVFNEHYFLKFFLAGPYLGSAPDLVINITYRGCEIGQEAIFTTNSGICKQCASGFYNLNGNGTCLSCPPNSICNGGSDIRANDNYFLLDKSGVASTYICPNGMCKNGTCTVHRSGVLCGTCDPGFQSVSTGSCIECNKSHYSDALFGDIVLLWLFVAVLQFSSQLPKRYPRHDRHAISGLTNIILFFLQTVSLVSNPQETLGRLFSFFNFEFFFAFSHHCALKLDFYGDFLLSILMPLMLFGILVVNLVLQLIVHTFFKFCNHDKLSAYTKVDMTTYIRTICSLVLFSYSHVTQAVFTFVNCRTVGPYRVVASSPDISCNSTRYKDWSIFAYILFSYVILLPIALLIILIKMYKNQQMNFSYFAAKFGIIFQCFKTKSFYWQVVILFRRLLFIMIYVVAFSAPFAQSLALCIFSVIVLSVHLCMQPFYFEIDNMIESALLSLLAIIAGIHSAAINKISPSQISTFSAVITILAVVPIAISLYCQFQYFLIRWGLLRKPIGHKKEVPMQPLEPSSDTLQPTPGI